MTQAVTVRRDGDTFQARLFWWYAARLLDHQSPIVRVGFENGPKSFDDIWVEYDPSRSALDHYGEPVRRDHIQCKWHVAPDTYGFSHLIDPEFVNANARSLLERAHDAQRKHAPDGAGVRFKLLTNWRLDRADPLRQMIGTRSNAIRLDRLYGTVTDNSKAGTVRKTWREHLGIDDDELRTLARTLAFGEATDSLDGLRDNLDILFGYVGLRRVPANESAFPYDDLIFQWMAQGRLEFDRKSFETICNRENLLGRAEERPRIYGVKSFEHPIDRLEQRCDQVLNLVPTFDDRFIRSDADWADTLYPALRAFLLAAAQDQAQLRLVLDTHTTLAFAAGSVLNVKSGRHLMLEQRSVSREVWAADDRPPDPQWPKLVAEQTQIDAQQPDLVVAIGLTHDITSDVRRYVDEALPTVGQVLALRPSVGAGAQSVACGRHAFDLAEAVAAAIREMRGAKASTMVHIFIAAPNAFTFFLGQRQPSLGVVRLYEFDFEGSRGRSYTPALTFSGSLLQQVP